MKTMLNQAVESEVDVSSKCKKKKVSPSNVGQSETNSVNNNTMNKKKKKTKTPHRCSKESTKELYFASPSLSPQSVRKTNARPPH